MAANDVMSVVIGIAGAFFLVCAGVSLLIIAAQD